MQAALAAAATTALCTAAWPGMMSYDSLFAYDQMASGITSSGYPPMMSYVWYLTDLIVPGPGGMLLLQTSLLFGSLGILLHALRAGPLASVLAFMLTSCSAAVTGPMMVIRRDIGMSAFFLASVALAAIAVDRRSSLAVLLAFACLTIGACFRLNSLPAAVPLCVVVAGAHLLVRGQRLRWRSLTIVGGAAFCIVAVTGALSISYRLPDLKRLPFGSAAKWVGVHDLMGISACIEMNLLPATLSGARPLSGGDIASNYRPEHVHLSFDMTGSGDPRLLRQQGLREPGVDIGARWLDAVTSHPSCYLWHRMQVLEHMLGLNAGPVFYITHGQVDANDHGFSARPSGLRDAVLGYVIGAAEVGALPHRLLARVWLLGLLAAASIGCLSVRRSSLLAPGALLATSAFLYLLGGTFLLLSADARYQHWASVAFVITTVMAIVDLGKGAPPGRGARTMDSPGVAGHVPPARTPPGSHDRPVQAID